MSLDFINNFIRQKKYLVRCLNFTWLKFNSIQNKRKDQYKNNFPYLQINVKKVYI